MQVNVTGTTFIRDTESKALVNRDVAGLQDYKAKRKFAEVQRQEINNIKTEMKSIKDDVQEIKQLMQLLLKKG